MANSFARASLALLSAVALTGLGACSSGGGGLNFGAPNRAGPNLADNSGNGGNGGNTGNTGNTGGNNGNNGGSGGPQNPGGPGDPAAPPLTPASTGTLERVVDDLLSPVVAGNALLPGAEGLLNDLAQTGDGILNPAAVVNIAGQTLVGSSDPNASQLLALNMQSNNPGEGDLATVGLLQDGQAVSVQTASLPGQQGLQTIASGVTAPIAARIPDVAGGLPAVVVNAGGATLGSAGAPVGLAVLSPAGPAGSALNVGVLSGDQMLTLNTGDTAGALPAPVAGLVNTVQEAASGQQLVQAGVAGVAAGGGGGAIGLGVAAPVQPGGSIASVGVLTGGETLTASLGGTQILPPTGGLNGTIPGGLPAGDLVGGTLETVSALTGGLTAGLPVTGGAPGAGGALAPVTDVVSGVTGGLGNGAGGLGALGGLGGLLGG